MKKIASFALLLLAACASPTAVIDKRGFRCGPGQDIEVRAGLDDGSINREIGSELKYLVEIANNSHHDVFVTSVRIEPSGEKIAGVESAHKAFDQLIAEGEEHVFEIPASAWVPGRDFAQQVVGRRVEFRVTVGLSNGDSYHCQFAALWR
jgi:hypothetical protein